MGRPTRILHVLGAFNRGGVENWLLHLLRWIDRERFRLDFVVHSAAPGALDDEVRALGGTIFPCPYPASLWSYARRLRRLLRVHGPYDVVHSHVHHFSGLVLRLARQAGVPVRIAHSHTTETMQNAECRMQNERQVFHSAFCILHSALRFGYLALMRHWLSRHATIRLSASRQAHEALFGQTDGRCSQDEFLRCGIDLAPFAEEVDSASVRAEFGLPPDAFVLGHVGRFDPCKNHSLLVAVAAEVLRHVPNTYLLLVGEGKMRAAIEAEAERRGIRNRVIFAGGRGDVARLLKGAMDVFVFPSRYEGLGLAAVEAQAAGVPCVLSDGVPEEATVVAALVRRRLLSQPAEVWADMVLATRTTPPAISRREAWAAVERSPFNVRAGVEQLQRLYASARQGEEVPR